MRKNFLDELLARIRDIRASERPFYQKVRDLFALSSDYKGREQDTSLFFAEVQNKLLYAATRHTAAELIVTRADSAQPNRTLTTWSGSRVRKQDVIIAKNYLTQDEIATLNRLVVIFLEQAELRVKQKKDLTLDYWWESVDKMLTSNEQPLLEGPGSVSHDDMKRDRSSINRFLIVSPKNQPAVFGFPRRWTGGFWKGYKASASPMSLS